MSTTGPRAVQLLPTALLILLVLYTSCGLLLMFNVRKVATGFAGTDPLKQSTTTFWRLAGAVMVVFGAILLSWIFLHVR